MESQERQDLEAAELAPDGQSDSRHHSAETTVGSLPTDSMVTVRLSDSPVATILETLSITHIAEQFLGHELADAQEDDPSLDEDHISTVHDNAIILQEDKEEFPRESMASMTSIVDDEPSISTSGTLRSRSDSSGTVSSAGSAQVDWDELEKSEEQVPRDGGSDEVYFSRTQTLV